MFKRLNSQRSNTNPLFWRTADYLLNKSSVFLSQSMHEVLKGWHRKHSYGVIWNDIREVRKLNIHRYIHREHEIPKPQGVYRTLGFPSRAWRIYLHGLNRSFRSVYPPPPPYAHPNQHGFQHGKGTDIAWLKIHHEVITDPDIYEYDLKKYFDTLNLDYLSVILHTLQLPAPL